MFIERDQVVVAGAIQQAFFLVEFVLAYASSSRSMRMALRSLRV